MHHVPPTSPYSRPYFSNRVPNYTIVIPTVAVGWLEFLLRVWNILVSHLDSSSAVRNFFIPQGFEFIIHYHKLTPQHWSYCWRLCIKNKLIIHDTLFCPCFVIITASSYKSKQKMAAMEVILVSVKQWLKN
jgi:hypothetical protein